MRHIWTTIALLVCVEASGQGVPAADYGEPLPLYYDASTGNATLDLTNVFQGVSAGYTLTQSILCGEPCQAFRPENHTPFMESLWVTADGGTISETSFNGVPGGVYSIGAVFPAGLSERELVDAYFTPDPLDQIGFFVIGPAGSGKAHALHPVYAPSPFPALNDAGIGPSTIVDEWASEAELRYNAMTGELSIDTSVENGGAVLSYDVQFTEPLVRRDDFLPALAAGRGSAVAMENRIVEVGWEGIPAGNYSLGTVLPAGLSASELESMVDYARFLGQPGHDVASFDIHTSGISMSLHFVPEPSGIHILGVAILSLLALARKHPMSP